MRHAICVPCIFFCDKTLNKMKNSNNEQEKAFYGAFIAHTQMELKEMGVDAFEYKII